MRRARSSMKADIAAALEILSHIKKQEQPRVLNYIGYTTRKLGDVDKGLDYYHRALALDPNYLRAREYLGEGYLQKGDVGKAREQLIEIADRCGNECEEYAKLEKAILAFVSDGKELRLVARSGYAEASASIASMSASDRPK